MLRIARSAAARAAKVARLDEWAALAAQDPQAALEDRLARSAMAAVGMVEAENQDAVLALLTPRSIPPDRFAAFQRALLDARIDETLRRLEIENLLTPPPEAD